jgi:hypothetical protein
MSALNSHQQNDDDFQSITRIFDTGSLLHCPLCKNDIQDPRILCSNGHTFCHNCIKVRFYPFKLTPMKSLFFF